MIPASIRAFRPLPPVGKGRNCTGAIVAQIRRICLTDSRVSSRFRAGMGNWRLTFGWRNGDAADLDLDDFHRGSPMNAVTERAPTLPGALVREATLPAMGLSIAEPASIAPVTAQPNAPPAGGERLDSPWRARSCRLLNAGGYGKCCPLRLDWPCDATSFGAWLDPSRCARAVESLQQLAARRHK